jgi:hypothetical protein
VDHTNLLVTMSTTNNIEKKKIRRKGRESKRSVIMVKRRAREWKKKKRKTTSRNTFIDVQISTKAQTNNDTHINTSRKKKETHKNILGQMPKTRNACEPNFDVLACKPHQAGEYWSNKEYPINKHTEDYLFLV